MKRKMYQKKKGKNKRKNLNEEKKYMRREKKNETKLNTLAPSYPLDEHTNKYNKTEI